MSGKNAVLGAVLWVLSCAAFLVGCDDSTETDADADSDADVETEADADQDGDVGDAGDADQVPLPVVSVTDENNYSITATLDIPSITTVSGADLEICWDGLLEDIRCHAMDPVADIDNLGLIRFGALTPEDVEEQMSSGALQQSDITGYLNFEPTGDTCTMLTTFSLLGSPVDVESEYVEGGGTHMLVLTTGTTPGVGARMITFLVPDEESTNTAVDIGSGCDVVTVDADLSSLTPLAVPRTGEWQLDWSALTTDGQGNDLQTGRIDGIMVAYYEGAAIGDLEASFLDLEIDATWLLPPTSASGRTFDFLAGWGGDTSFETYPEDAGIWLLGLTCSRCYTPAPLFLTVIEPGDL